MSVGGRERKRGDGKETREVREEQRDISHLCVSTVTDGSPTFLLKICFKNSHPLPA